MTASTGFSLLASPGGDGLPYELYRAFEDLFTPVLRTVFNTSFQAAQHQLQTDPGVPDSRLAPFKELLVGVLCLLPKPDQAQDEVAKHRPITLLNCDIKLVLIVMANRLQLPCDYLIDVCQSAYVLGRDISDNVRWHLGLTARLEELGLPGWLQCSDIKKAYDRTDRSFLARVKERMGFKIDGHILWGRILLNGSQARVRINGFLSGIFDVTSNIPQGSQLSCMDWVIAFQPLFSYLNSFARAGQLSSFPLPSGRLAPPVVAYADDVSTIILDHTQLATAVKPAFLTLASAGAAEQSVEKTEHLHLRGLLPPAMDPALQPDHRHQPTGYKLLTAESEARLRHLGVPLDKSVQTRLTAAFGNMDGKILGAGKRWQPILLTRFGRSHVANQCLLSKVVFQSQFHKPAKAQSLLIQRAVNQFVARSQRPEERTPNSSCLFPKAATCHLPTSCGGLGLLDIEAQVISLQAKPCWKLFDYTNHPWAELFSHELALVPRHRRTISGVSGAIGGVSGAGAAAAANSGAQDNGPHMPGLPPGPHWIVTCPDAGRANVKAIVTPSTQSSVEAFLSLGISRIISPSDMDFDSILLEATFHNFVIKRLVASAQDPSALYLGAVPHDQDQDQDQPDQDQDLPADQDRHDQVQDQAHRPLSQGLTPSDLTSPSSRNWLRLRDVRAAFLDRDHLSPLEIQDLRIIINALPEAWRVAVCCDPRDHSPPWRVVSPPGAALTILEGPDPMFIIQDPTNQAQAYPVVQAQDPTSAPSLRWLLIPASGQLIRYPTPNVQDPDYVPRPALVVSRPLPEHIWKRPDYNFVQDQEQLPARDRRVLLQPRLVGIWDEMQLDPRVWGLPASAFSSVQDQATDPVQDPDHRPFAQDPATHPVQDLDPDPVQAQDQNHQRRNTTVQDQDQASTSSTSISLLDMSVRLARLLVARRLAQSRNIPGFAIADSVLPRIWRSTSTAVNDTTVTTATPHLALRALGLEGLEEYWRRDVLDDGDLDTWPQADVDREPSWLDLASRTDNSARHARAATRQARNESDSAGRRDGVGGTVAVAGGGGTAAAAMAAAATAATTAAATTAGTEAAVNFVGVWPRLCDPTLPRPFRSTCWAILHGVIGVNAFIFHTLRQPNRPAPDPASRLCSHPACLASGAHENITHAFLDCPAAAPAIDWLLTAWQNLSGATSPPPRTAAVLLADDINAWPADTRPSDARTLDLWTRLRVNVIGAIWRVRCLRSETNLRDQSLARRAITIAVDSIVEAIQRDFQRTQGDLRDMENTGGNFCSSWWRGRDTKMAIGAFQKIWARPAYFCSVEGPADDRRLQLHLGQDQPIPFPA